VGQFFFKIVKDSFLKNDVPQKEFLEHLGLFVKNYLPIQFMESIWFKHLVLHFCPKLTFPSKRYFQQEILLGLIENTS
jgi:hypothetical protein